MSAPTTWTQTDLSVVPASWQIAAADSETFAFDAQTPITGATATLIRLDTGAAAGTVTAGALPLAGTVASAAVSGLTAGVTYLLEVTFTAAGGRRWSRTLALVCVA